MNRLPPTRRLSIGTLFYKRVFPVFFVVGGIVAVGFGLWNATMRAGSFMEVIPFVGVTAVGFAIIRFVAADLADEVLDGGDYLLVRKDGIEERVPLTEIETVTESIWNKRPPRLELVRRSAGKLGRVIAFIPTNYSVAPFSKSALFYELTDRVVRVQSERSPSTGH
jgi:hypothetical protein